MKRTIRPEELAAVREAALELHTRLLAQARLRHLAQHGPISAGELLQRAAFSDELQWLRPLTRWIVELDEQLDRAAVSRG